MARTLSGPDFARVKPGLGMGVLDVQSSFRKDVEKLVSGEIGGKFSGIWASEDWKLLISTELYGAWLLLGEAVKGAEAPDEIDGVNADDGAVGEKFGENSQR